MAFILLVSGREVMAEYVPGEVLVKFRSASDPSAIGNLHSGLGSVKKKEFGRIGLQHIKLPANLSVEKAVEYYKLDPNVEYAEPNYIVHAYSIPLNKDTYFDNLWGLNNTGQIVNGAAGTADADINAPEAWDITTGSDSVIIAVVDTGVAYDHPDFADNIWINPGEVLDGQDNDNNGYIDDIHGWDFVDNDGYPEDFNLHGTHVAGTIAAQGNDSSGITGVMWNAAIMPVRFLDLTGSGTTADAIAAIDYATKNGAHIINNSWGGTGFSQALKDAIDAFPGIVVCAAGNGGLDVIGDNNDTTPSYPASYNSPNIISVAATNNNDSLADFSNYGATSVDVAAPGVNIYSTIPARDSILLDNFDDGDLSSPDWTTGGSPDNWTVSSGRLADSPAGNYQNNTNSWAQTEALSFSGKQGCKLSYEMKLDTRTSDVLYIEASLDNIEWTTLNDYSGTTIGIFINFIEDLTDYDGKSTVYIRYRLKTNSSSTDDGAYIDDVEITCASDIYDGTEYKYENGTSMAAPHVSGVAGLILANNPSLAHYQVKAIILNSVDPKTSLNGKFLTGGRLNANNAVLSLPTVPTGLSATVVSQTQINLSWTDNTDDESGFKIERRTGANGNFSGNFSEIASVGGDVISYSDTGLSQGTKYYYRVRVFGGTSGDFSYSNEDNATTLSASSGNISNGGGGGGGGGGSCFIATAAYGSMMHPYVKELRDFRDNHLLTNAPGRAFIELYYRCSPPVADTIRESESLRFLTRLMLTPLVMLVVYPYYLTGLLILLAISGAFIRRSTNIRR